MMAHYSYLYDLMRKVDIGTLTHNNVEIKSMNLGHSHKLFQLAQVNQK